jgi:hypothetical protein
VNNKNNVLYRAKRIKTMITVKEKIKREENLQNKKLNMYILPTQTGTVACYNTGRSPHDKQTLNHLDYS